MDESAFFCYGAGMFNGLKDFHKLLRREDVNLCVFCVCSVVLLPLLPGADGLPLRRVAEPYLDMCWLCWLAAGFYQLRALLLRLREGMAKRFGSKRCRAKLRALSQEEKALLCAWVEAGVVCRFVDAGEKPVHDLLAAGVLRVAERGEEQLPLHHEVEAELAPYVAAWAYSDAGRDVLGAKRPLAVEYAVGK
ncbi:MAG: hypothetical protein IJA81_09075 [Akkermansia sp.]|nr:hypothetical protein [Akkermansia sp.]